MSARRLVACLAILGVLGLALLPAEHLHASVDGDHHAEIVHRHFAPHHPAGTGARLDDDDHDGDAQYLTVAFTLPGIAALPGPSDIVFVVPFPLPEPPQLFGWTLPAPDASSHDPPRPSNRGPRAPPISPA